MHICKKNTTFAASLEQHIFLTIKLNNYICIKKIIELAKELYLSPIIDNSAKIEQKTNNQKILKFIPKMMIIF